MLDVKEKGPWKRCGHLAEVHVGSAVKNVPWELRLETFGGAEQTAEEDLQLLMQNEGTNVTSCVRLILFRCYSIKVGISV